MKVALISGKGGTGKTFIATNLARLFNNALYVDADVEEPNGSLFLNAPLLETQAVYKHLPYISAKKCIKCYRCVDFCAFNALALSKECILLFPTLCHDCHGCAAVCPQGALSYMKKEIGHLERRQVKETTVLSGVLNVGEASGTILLEKLNELIKAETRPVIIDAPPGSGCSVMAAIEEADICLAIVEPTAFGFANFKTIYALTQALGKRLAVVVNKVYGEFKELERFLQAQNLPCLTGIPLRKDIALKTAKAELVLDDASCLGYFEEIQRKLLRLSR